MALPIARNYIAVVASSAKQLADVLATIFRIIASSHLGESATAASSSSSSSSLATKEPEQKPASLFVAAMLAIAIDVALQLALLAVHIAEYAHGHSLCNQTIQIR
jgi:hypothetical protein